MIVPFRSQSAWVAVSICGVLHSTGLCADPPRGLRSDGSSSILWLKEFSSPDEDWINDLIPLRDGNYLAVGYLGRADGETESDWRALAVKLNANGDILWQREHGAGGRIDAYWSAEEMKDGNLALAGFTSRIGAGQIDAFFSVLDAQGGIVGENAFGGPKYDRVTDLAPSPDGGFVLAGMTYSFGAGERDIFLLKVDANGIEQWRRIYGGPGDDAGLYVEPATDGGFVIAGGTEGEHDDAQILVLKVDNEGREVWRKEIGEPSTDDVNHGLVVLPDGRIVVPGYSKSWQARDNDIAVAVLRPMGQIARIDQIGGVGDDRPILAKADSHGVVWITGYTKSAGAGGWDVVVTGYNPDRGFENVFSTFGGAADDNGTAIQPLPDGSFLVAGYSQDLSTASVDAFVMRVSAFKERKLPKTIRRRTVQMEQK